MSRATKWFWAVALAQAVFLLAWAGYHEFVRQHAPVILLKGRPVDPQDLLRGDYMTIGYDINSTTFSDGTPKPIIGGDVWVLLEQREKYFVIAKASRERVPPEPGQVLVRATGGFNSGANTRITYGIERYFVPEGKGSPRFKLMEVEASVSPAHRLYIKRVLLDGQAYP
jgi:uncharacterized membrane-anchored protein